MSTLIQKETETGGPLNWKLELENGTGTGNWRLEIRRLEIGRLEIVK